MTTYKTPGVYIQELSLFPPSVAEVATAIPAFIGYTRIALASNGDNLAFKPTKIKSLLEFETLFGQGFVPGEYKVYVTASISPMSVDRVSTGIRFHLYDALRLYFDNGGGDCYIVSAGLFGEAWSYDDSSKTWGGSGISFDNLLKGIKAIAKLDEPTLIVFPDGTGLPGSDRFSKLGELQQEALSQSGLLKDRFVILDIADGFLPANVSFDPVETFRQHTGMNALSYGAAYYPWLKSSFTPEINWKQLSFRQEGGGSESAADIDALLASDPVYALLLTRKADLKTVTEKITLLKNGRETIELRLSNLEAELAATTDETILKPKLSEYLRVLSAIATFFPSLEATAGNDLKKVVNVLKAETGLQEAIRKLISLEKSNKITGLLNDETPAGVTATYAPFATATTWTGNIKFADIPKDTVTYVAGEQSKVITVLTVSGVVTRVTGALAKLGEEASRLKDYGEKSLLENHPFFKSAVDQVKEMMRLVPPSGAVAGIYAATDRTRGVWKAPANTSVQSVVGPAVKIDNREQETLNVDPAGKSVNAIRSFTGKGTLVWGARTLAGNDGEWKYIPVRRFFNNVEESVKKATEPFTFEPNDKNTWVKVRAMIENYLTLLWRAGALQGSKPSEAFFVNVGLGETMTSLDVLEGRMIVEIGMAAVRPAEFIVLRFSHKMVQS